MTSNSTSNRSTAVAPTSLAWGSWPQHRHPALVSDSTNAEEPGFTESESTVGVTLRRVFAAQSGKRIVVACFASHMHRVQQMIDAAVASGRKVATLGRSMGKNVELGSRLGII